MDTCKNCLFVSCFTTLLRIFHSYGDVTVIPRKGVKFYELCSALTASHLAANVFIIPIFICTLGLQIRGVTKTRNGKQTGKRNGKENGKYAMRYS